MQSRGDCVDAHVPKSWERMHILKRIQRKPGERATPPKMILALPQEIRKLIYDMVIELERKEGVLSSSRWLHYHALLVECEVC